MMRLPTKTNIDSVTRRYFHNYTLLFKGLLPLLILWHSNLWPCSHHQESGLLDNGGPCSPASNPVTAQPSLAWARRWAAEPTEEPSSSQSSLPSWKLEADYIRAVMHNCWIAKAFYHMRTYIWKHRVMEFYPFFFHLWKRQYKCDVGAPSPFTVLRGKASSHTDTCFPGHTLSFTEKESLWAKLSTVWRMHQCICRAPACLAEHSQEMHQVIPWQEVQCQVSGYPWKVLFITLRHTWEVQDTHTSYSSCILHQRWGSREATERQNRSF